MVSVSLRMNARSSPVETVKRACCKTKKTAGRSAPVPAAATVEVEPKEEKKYIHVHKFKNTNLYGAWFNKPGVAGKKERLFFGSHQTAYLAARAQDRAALKYRRSAKHPEKIKLNFKEEDYKLDEGLRRTMRKKEFGYLLRSESRPTYKKVEPTPLLSYFMAEERALGNLPQEMPNEAKAKDVIPLVPHLIDVITKRKRKTKIPDFSFLNEAYRKAYEALSLKGIEDPFLFARVTAPIAKPVDHVLCPAGPSRPTEKRKKRQAISPAGREEERNKHPRQESKLVPMKSRIVAALNEPRALRSSAKPLPTTPVSTVAVAKSKSVKEINIQEKLVWVPQRPRSEPRTPLASRYESEFMAPGNARNKHQYKLHKVGITQASELIQTATLPAEVEEVVPMVEGMVPQVEEMVPEAYNFSLFMLADVAALQ